MRPLLLLLALGACGRIGPGALAENSRGAPLGVHGYAAEQQQGAAGQSAPTSGGEDSSAKYYRDETRRQQIEKAQQVKCQNNLPGCR